MIANLMNLLFEPRYPRYIGRHRAPAHVRYVAVAPAPTRTLG
jgi:hypothetical protein